MILLGIKQFENSGSIYIYISGISFRCLDIVVQKVVFEEILIVSKHYRDNGEVKNYRANYHGLDVGVIVSRVLLNELK